MWIYLLSILICVYLGFGYYLYANQEKYIYFPTAALEVKNAERITIEHDGVSLILTVLNPGQEQAIIYFGGNSEAVESNSGQYGTMFSDKTVYLVSYRGYGHSTGTPSEAAFYKDSEIIYDELYKKHTTLSVIGRSLGSGVATWLASVRTLEQLILVTPYDSITNVAQDKYPFYPVDFILKHKFDSLSRAAGIDIPVLILIAENDELIPPAHSYQLAKALSSAQVEVKLIKDANHNNIISSPKYSETLQNFVH